MKKTPQKHKIWLLVSVSFAGILAAALPARADMIEVKGKGLMMGQVLKDDADSVTFKDNWGKTSVYPKSAVLYIEKQKAAAAIEATPSSAADKHVPFQEEISKLAQLSDLFKAKLLRKFLEFLTLDPNGVNTVVESARSDAANFRKIYSASGLHLLLCALVALALAGAAGSVLFLVYIAFQEDFLWFIFLAANGLFVFKERFGGAVGLLLLIPNFFTGYYVYTRWRLVRKTVAVGFFCADFVLLGYYLLKALP